MSKRLRAFLLGTQDAMPSDYVLALIGTIGLMMAIVAGL